MKINSNIFLYFLIFNISLSSMLGKHTRYDRFAGISTSFSPNSETILDDKYDFILSGSANFGYSFVFKDDRGNEWDICLETEIAKNNNNIGSFGFCHEVGFIDYLFYIGQKFQINVMLKDFVLIELILIELILKKDLWRLYFIVGSEIIEGHSSFAIDAAPAIFKFGITFQKYGFELNTEFDNRITLPKSPFTTLNYKRALEEYSISLSYNFLN